MKTFHRGLELIDCSLAVEIDALVAEYIVQVDLVDRPVVQFRVVPLRIDRPPQEALAALPVLARLEPGILGSLQVGACQVAVRQHRDRVQHLTGGPGHTRVGADYHLLAYIGNQRAGVEARGRRVGIAAVGRGVVDDHVGAVATAGRQQGQGGDAEPAAGSS